VLGSPFHMGADRGRRRVKDIDFVALDDVPPPVLVGIVGNTFIDDPGGAVAQRPVDDVAVAGHPTDVCGAPVDGVGLDVEDVVVGCRGAHQVTGGGVDDTLGLGGRPTRVQQVQEIFGVHLLARAGFRIDAGALDRVVPPHISAGLHRGFGGGAPKYDARL